MQNFIKKEGYNPITEFMQDVSIYWEAFERKTVRFPLFLKIGKVA